MKTASKRKPKPSATRSLRTDMVRCLGALCHDANNCERYLACKEEWHGSSYMEGGGFVNGVCLYRIEANTNPGAPQ